MFGGICACVLGSYLGIFSRFTVDLGLATGGAGTSIHRPPIPLQIGQRSSFTEQYSFLKEDKLPITYPLDTPALAFTPLLYAYLLRVCGVPTQ